MLAVMLFIIFVAGAAYMIRHAWIRHREARAYGRHMHVRYVGHNPHNQRRASSTADFVATTAPDDDRSWQPDDAGPSALDLLYEQMAAQEEGYRRRERERDLGY